MPFYKEIIMFEKIQNKMTINHIVATHAFTRLKTKQNKAQQQIKKSKQSTPKPLCSQLMLFSQSLK